MLASRWFSSEAIEIVILAQGAQRRLGNHAGPRQLLPLPSCGGAPILSRTLRQLGEMYLQESAAHPRDLPSAPVVTVVAESSLTDALFKVAKWPIYTASVELPVPGNSALKGIARYLELRESQGHRYQRTIVLLGDVVYSWDCLLEIWDMSQKYGFVGTKNLSLSKGDLWGAGWSRPYEDWMLTNLRDALLRRPPFDDDPEPSQLRRWISGMQRGDLADHIVRLRWAAHYADADDYTHDIDVAHDLVLLPELSSLAAKDDAEHGVFWTNP
jgi:hypothetical protein